ncbi:MAG: fumarylacetoacetate hydrolase family protein [Oscillospiraceae bacterium]|nr:fumarylacetoacetate hydrolase family protein [Oscillospiraceae bacterium]
MRWIRCAHPRHRGWAVVEGALVRPLDRAPWLHPAPGTETIPLREVRLLAPAEPSKIVAVGKNYSEHARELGGEVPEHPILFLKPPTAIQDPDAPIVYPRLARRVDYEGELAFLVGRTARHVPAARAADYIVGYTCFNDVTARDIQTADGQWTRAKGFDTFAPVGPWLVGGLDPANLTLTTRLNGVVRQRASTGQFLWTIPELLAFITAGMTLLPGDLVTTGTPVGVGPLLPGDTVEVEIEGIGLLRNPVEAEK